MKIIVLMDSFKGSLTSGEAGIDEIYFATPDDMEINKAMKRDIAMTNIERTVCGIMRENRG